MSFYQLKEVYYEVSEGETRRRLEEILLASYNGDLEAVRAAVKKDPMSVNDQHELTGSTALHYACGMGRYSIVEYLLTCERINVDLQDTDGLTALEKAQMCGHPGIITMLKLATFPFLRDLGYRGEGVEPAPYPTPEEGGSTEEELAKQSRRAWAILSRFEVEGGPDDRDIPPPPQPTGP